MTDLIAAMEPTWPPAARRQAGVITLREGRDGGQRVSAATAGPGWDAAALDAAEAAMRAMGQYPLFQLGEDAALDTELVRRGYRLVDPVVLMAAPLSDLPAGPERMTAFPHWPPLQIALSIWQEGGIGPGRIAVMERAAGPKAALLGRTGDRPSGAGFVAVSGSLAVLHALEVLPAMRRQGAGRNLVLAAAAWARAEGAERLALAVTEANHAARALYASLGLQAVGRYHYRALEG